MDSLQEMTDARFLKFDAPQQEADFDKMKEIRLAGTLSETKIPRGNFYLVDFNVSKGEQPIQTDIGPEVEVYILRHAMKIRKWDNEQNRTVIDSTEFRTFSDLVVLYDVNMIPSRIVAALPYTHKNADLPSIGGKSEKSLKRQHGLSVRYVHYVLYKGEVCRMNVTATDNSGATDGDKPLEFGKESLNSFEGMRHSLGDATRSKIYLYKVTLKGKDHSKKLMLKTFNNPQIETDEKMKATILEKLNDLYGRLSDSFWAKFTKALENTNVESLDTWSQAVVASITDKGTDVLLFSQTKEMNVPPKLMEGQVIDMPHLASSPVDVSTIEAVAADLGGESKSGIEAAAEVFFAPEAPNEKGSDAKMGSGKNSRANGGKGKRGGGDNETE